MSAPFLISMLGLPGSGKSYFASRLSKDLPGVWLNSDSFRAAMFEHPTEVTDPKLRYDAVFGAIDHVAKQVLEAGVSVIYDANNHRRSTRDEHRQLAENLGARAILVYMDVPQEISDERAITRAQNGYQTGMTPEKLQKHKARIELPGADETAITIDGAANYAEQLASFQRQFETVNGQEQ